MAKIAGIKLCQAYARQHGANFISAMPTNLYGPGDNFDLQTSDVLPALIRKMHEAKMQNRREVVILGTGTPRREFLHTHDLADALRFLLENYDSPQIINVGCGYDITIRDLALLVAKVVGIDAELVFRYVGTRGHTTEAPGYQSPPAIGLATKDHPRRWSSGHLSMVFAEFEISMLATSPKISRTKSLVRFSRYRGGSGGKLD